MRTIKYTFLSPCSILIENKIEQKTMNYFTSKIKLSFNEKCILFMIILV